MQRIRLLPLMAAILFVLAGASDAHAGQYTLSYDFAADFSGWGGYVEPGYLLCGRSSPAGCPDIGTNRIMARVGGAQAIWSQGRWEWTAPPGTTIVGGALAYRTRMRHGQFFARVKMRAAGDWADAPTLLAEQQTAALTDHVIALPGGYRQVGVSLYAHPAVAGLIADPWDDYVTLVRHGRHGAGRDAAGPGLARWRRPARRRLAPGRRLRGARDRRRRVRRRRGVARQRRRLVRLDRAAQPARSTSPGSPAPRPGSASRPRRSATACTPASWAAQMPAAGRRRRCRSLVRIDRTPPVASLVAPAAVATDARPAVALDVGDATSGVASVAIQIDGAPLALELAGARVSARPATALAYGDHALAWSLVDAAGNRSDGGTHFSVPDTTAPAIGAPQPQAGASLGDGEALSVTVAVSDDGSGVDPGLARSPARRRARRPCLARRRRRPRRRRAPARGRGAPSRAAGRGPRGQRGASRLGLQRRRGRCPGRRQYAGRRRDGGRRRAAGGAPPLRRGAAARRRAAARCTPSARTAGERGRAS